MKLTPSLLSSLRFFRKFTNRRFLSAFATAALFAMTNFAAHCFTAYYTAELNAKTLATAFAFAVVSFSLTMCVLEAIANDIEELGVVDPSAVLSVMILYICGLCFIFCAAHAEVIYVAAKKAELSPLTILSSLGLFFAIFFQACIEWRLLKVFERAKTRYPQQHEHKKAVAATLQALVIISLVISLMKVIAKFANHYMLAAPYLVAVDAIVVLYAVSLAGEPHRPGERANAFEQALKD